MSREAWETFGNYTANVLMVLGLIVLALGILAGPEWLIAPGTGACFTAALIWTAIEWTAPEHDEEEEWS